MHDHAHSPSPGPLKKYIHICFELRLGLGILSLIFFCGSIPRASAQQNIEPQQVKRMLARAEESFSRGDFADSEAIFERMSRIYPQDSFYLFNYGASLLELGRYEDAIDAFRRAEKMHGNLRFPSALYLAEAYRRKGETSRAALVVHWLLRQKNIPPQLLEEILQLNERIEEAGRSLGDFNELVNLGIWEYKNQRYSMAYSYFNGALQIQRSWDAFLLVALTKIELGAIEEAKIILRDIIAKSDDDPLIRAAKAIIAELEIAHRTSLFVNTEFGAAWNDTAFTGTRFDSYDANAKLRVGYRFLEEKEWRLIGRYSLKADQQVLPRATSMFIQDIAGVLGYNSGGWQMESGLSMEASNFPDEIFLVRFIGGWAVAYQWKPSRLLATIQGVSNLSQDAKYSFISGQAGIGKLDYTYHWSNASLGIYAIYAVDNVRDSALSANSIVPIANAKTEAGEHMRFDIGRDWILKGGASIARKRYFRNSQPDDRQRIDIQYGFHLGADWRGVSPYSFDLDLGYLINQSTINDTSASDQRYKELTLRLGLLWDMMP